MKKSLGRRLGRLVGKLVVLIRKNKVISIVVAVIVLITIVGIIVAACSGSGSSTATNSGISQGQSASDDAESEEKSGGLFSFFTKKSGSSDSGNISDIVEEDPVILAYNADTKDGYMNNCIFLGDSRTVAAVNYGFLQDDNVLAQVGIAHTSFAKNTFTNNSGKQYTMDSFLASHPAPVIYLSLGVNGMNGISEDKYKSTYEELVDDIMSKSPESNLVIMSIWPVDDNGRYKNSVQNSWIEKYNSFLLELCEKKGIHYLNVNEILTDDEGQMKVEYDAGDGLHYAPGAYTDILEYIIHHPVPGVSDTGSFVVKKVATNNTYTRLVNSGTNSTDDGTDLMAQAQLLEQQRQAAEAQKLAEAEASKKYAEEEAKRIEEERKKKEKEEAEAAAAAAAAEAEKKTECSHSYMAATCKNPETCSKCGATRGSANAQAHDFSGGSAKNCTRCGATNPNYVAPAVDPTPSTPEPTPSIPGSETPTPGTENPTPEPETPTVDPTPVTPEPETPSEPEPASEPTSE